MISKSTQKKMTNMFNGDLPIIEENVPVKYDRINNQRIYSKIPVEILTINFNTGSLRVRYIASIFSEVEKIEVTDIFNVDYVNSIIEKLKKE